MLRDREEERQRSRGVEGRGREIDGQREGGDATKLSHHAVSGLASAALVSAVQKAGTNTTDCRSSRIRIRRSTSSKKSWVRRR